MLNIAFEDISKLSYNSILLLTNPNLIEANHLYEKNRFETIPYHPEICYKKGKHSITMQLSTQVVP